MTTHRTTTKPTDLKGSRHTGANADVMHITDWPATNTPIGTPEQRDAARRVIEDLAHNPQDAAELMAMLGIEGAK